MSFRLIGLGKLLRAMYAEKSARRSLLLADIRQSLKKEKPDPAAKKGGGDFYVGFWADARKHVAGEVDLRFATDLRIKAHARNRQRLFPQLRDGFLFWWEEKRRLRNVPFTVIPDSVKARFEIDQLGVIKVENTLAFTIGDDGHRIVYPYLCEDPALSDEAARIGLWVMHQCVKGYAPIDMRVLDVFRGRSYSILETPLLGNEEQLLRAGYGSLVSEWDELRKKY